MGPWVRLEYAVRDDAAWREIFGDMWGPERVDADGIGVMEFDCLADAGESYWREAAARRLSFDVRHSAYDDCPDSAIVCLRGDIRTTPMRADGLALVPLSLTGEFLGEELLNARTCLRMIVRVNALLRPRLDHLRRICAAPWAKLLVDAGYGLTETGGGCTAWRRDAGEKYVLITDGDGSAELWTNDEVVFVGEYGPDDTQEIRMATLAGYRSVEDAITDATLLAGIWL